MRHLYTLLLFFTCVTVQTVCYCFCLHTLYFLFCSLIDVFYSFGSISDKPFAEEILDTTSTCNLQIVESVDIVVKESATVVLDCGSEIASTELILYIFLGYTIFLGTLFFLSSNVSSSMSTSLDVVKLPTLPDKGIEIGNILTPPFPLSEVKVEEISKDEIFNLWNFLFSFFS